MMERLDSHMQKNETRPLFYTAHKNFMCEVMDVLSKLLVGSFCNTYRYQYLKICKSVQGYM